VDGLVTSCKACVKAYGANHYLTNREIKLQERSAYRLANSARLAEAQRGYRNRNREKVAAYSRQYHRDNPDRSARSNYARRERMESHFKFQVTAKELLRIKNSPCVHCGAKGNTHIDHVVPVSKGGRHSIGNLMPLCKSCNLSKHDSFYFVFKIRKGKV